MRLPGVTRLGSTPLNVSGSYFEGRRRGPVQGTEPPLTRSLTVDLYFTLCHGSQRVTGDFGGSQSLS